MKKFIAIACLISSVSAFANNPAFFTGKYEVLATGKCDRDVGDRAYIKTSTYNGETNLEIQYYGMEAVLVEVPLNSGKRVSPGTSDAVDDVKVKWVNPQTLKVTVATSSPRASFVTKYSVSKKGNIVTVSEDNGGYAYSCELQKK